MRGTAEAVSEQSQGARHIPALDGLRGCAILLVIASHTQHPQNQSLGAAGVTLFFVLSGYLITSILLRGRDASTGHRVGLKAFYARRARRLLPALLLLLFFEATVRMAMGKSLTPVFLAAGYVSNFSTALGETSSLMHTWSLAMEEQFYLLWPLLIPFVVRLRRPGLALASVAVAVVAIRIPICVWGSWSFGWFSPFTRADGLLVGCALAFAVARGWRFPSGRVGHAAVIAALLVFAASFVWGDIAAAQVLLPLVVVASAVLVARCLDSSSSGPTVALLQLGPLRYAGRVSYGMYLWHPLVVALVLLRGLPAPFLVTTLVSLGIASVSWILVERPVLKPRSAPAQERRFEEKTKIPLLPSTSP